MKYYKITETGNVEITKDEYDAICAQLAEKSSLAGQLAHGEITIEEVPEEWREEVQQKAERRKQREAEATAEDYQAALADMGVGV